MTAVAVLVPQLKDAAVQLRRTCAAIETCHTLTVVVTARYGMAVGENDGYDTILYKISRYDTIRYDMIYGPKMLCRM